MSIVCFRTCRGVAGRAGFQLRGVDGIGMDWCGIVGMDKLNGGHRGKIINGGVMG